ncbi:MAG: radical SAM protein [Ruminococcus sp.]|jgi:MoaA/NifB/PqqE/SkfB family radical SAM enzyme|nr:radical SAM protein [Ruminococcus sp.]
MKYTYAPDFLFRGFERLPFVGIFPYRTPVNIKPELLDTLDLCDGMTDIPEVTEELKTLIDSGIVVPGETPPTDRQKYRYHKNRYFPAAKWQITGRCNYRCKHCFNAVDNSPIFEEFTLPEAKALVNEFERCGVGKVEVTGGEPTLHPNFLEILTELKKADIDVTKINTNGSRITPKLLAEIKAIGFHPLFAMSFDGIGFHDSFRGHDGAEEELLSAIKLLRSEGFAVKIDMNVNAENTETILPSAKLMDSMGVRNMRIDRTMETPRWFKNCKKPFTIRDYYEFALKFAEEYRKGPYKMPINFWHVLHVYPQSRTVSHGAEISGRVSGRTVVCGHNRGMLTVTNSGELAPCNQMSGILHQMGVSFGNVKETPLQNLLSDTYNDETFIKGSITKKPVVSSITAMLTGKKADGDGLIADLEGKFDGAAEIIPKNYLHAADMRLEELYERTPRCPSCKYSERCCGGCRAIPLGLTGSYTERDITKCIWFYEGYADRLETMIEKGAKVHAG